MGKIIYSITIIIAIILLSWIIFNSSTQKVDNILNSETTQMKIISSAFENNGEIPSKYTCDGKNVNPPLELSSIPKNTQTLVLIVHDPDAPSKDWSHWIVWNISNKTNSIQEDTIPQEAVQGVNDFKKNIYQGPCPPSGTHRYFFQIYALDNVLNIPKTSTKKDVEKAIKNHVIAYGELVGLYSKK